MGGKTRFDLGDAAANRFHTRSAELLILSLREYQSSLPIVVTLQKNEDSTASDAAERAAHDSRFAGQFGKAKPQHIHWRGSLTRLKTRQAAEQGKSAVRGQIANSAYGPVFFQQLSHVGMHREFEARIPGGFAGDEFKEAHLGHEQDVRESRLEAGEIEGAEVAVGKLDRRPGNFGMGNFVKFVGKANLIEDFESRGMNGVAAEFAVEVLVHFKKCDRNAATSQEQRQHRASGTATDNTAGSFLNVSEFLVCRSSGNSGRSGHGSFSPRSRKSCTVRNLTTIGELGKKSHFEQIACRARIHSFATRSQI